jgi:2-hydroxycyclohexanecarboxyl-CoA dehydrogenase
MVELSGRTAVVTGAGQGIGRGIALALARHGADVAVFELNPDSGERTATDIRELGRRALQIGLDVTQKHQVEEGFRRVLGEWGHVDILVNNVGWSPNAPFMETGPEVWDRIIILNFTSVLYCCRVALEHMIQRRWGRIINIASDAARVGTPREAVYAGAKAAVIGFSKSLAAEVAKYGITVNVVSPGTTDTPLIRSILTPEQIERRVQQNPMGRLGRPEDVAAAVLYFASDEAEYVTGQVLSVNGGIVRLG